MKYNRCEHLYEDCLYKTKNMDAQQDLDKLKLF